MKWRQYTIVILVGMLLTLSLGYADTVGEQNQLLQSYFEYLENGDTAGILSLLADPILSRKKELLSSNPAYANFLASLYQESDIRILTTEEIDTYSSKADIEVLFQGESKPAAIQILMKKIDGQWKIVDESE